MLVLARVPQIEVAGTIDHLMNPGDYLEFLFKNDREREVFLKKLEEACVSNHCIASFDNT